MHLDEEQRLQASLISNTEINKIEKKLKEKSEDAIEKGIEITKLKMKIDALTIDNVLLKKKRDVTNYQLRINRMQKGEKNAYKAEVSKERILAYKDQGMTHKEIAEKLEISKATIWRRLKKLINSI